jgi:hypothetical protein
MDDFSQMKIHIIKPSLVPDPEKKKKFVDRLKGKSRVKVANVASGLTFTLCNTATGHMQTILRHGDRWCMWGTECADGPEYLTNHELEDYLSEQWKVAQTHEKDLRIMDENGCLEWLPR